MNDLHPRLTAARPDLADARLVGKVEAARFVAGTPKRVVAASAPLRRDPRGDAALDTELLHGETVLVFEETAEGWAWVKLDSDGYVGWCPSEALGDVGAAPTHRVRTLRTFVYPGPSIKLAPSMLVSMNALVAVSAADAHFARTDAGFIYARHLAPLDVTEPDWVGVAEGFLGTPYLWGGRTSIGLDCSALVQMAMTAAGLPCPRDTDMQEAAVGTDLGITDLGVTDLGVTDLGGLQRGDLLFWKGHVAIARGDGTMIHANGHHMDTVVEPIAGAVDRIARAGLAVTSVRRP
ncbi:C40 family peptidase [Microbaculum sp. FT89]|uniref:C40 family peptidase n=1 Tax=Microbaculum sp. FT89 TaxID=3447298 RepID=UPI003F536B75